MGYQQLTSPFWARHPWLTAMLLLCGAWALTDASTALLVGLTSAAGLIAARRYWRTREMQRAGLRARADLEHRLALAGDPRGVHGRFPPVQAGWFPDPGRSRQIRYFDGASWTAHIASR